MCVKYAHTASVASNLSWCSKTASAHSEAAPFYWKESMFSFNYFASLPNVAMEWTPFFSRETLFSNPISEKEAWSTCLTDAQVLTDGNARQTFGLEWLRWRNVFRLQKNYNSLSGLALFFTREWCRQTGAARTSPRLSDWTGTTMGSLARTSSSSNSRSNSSSISSSTCVLQSCLFCQWPSRH